jgi:hypothetical protein
VPALHIIAAARFISAGKRGKGSGSTCAIGKKNGVGLETTKNGRQCHPQ